MNQTILYLGYENNPIHEFLKAHGEVTHTMEKIDDNFSMIGYDVVIVYGYPHILRKKIIETVNCQIINLHISYLPFNRGSDPNFWSWVDDTPKGVTIHVIDSGIDTGDILIQKEITDFKDNETLASSYNRLRSEVEKLFMERYIDILSGIIKPQPQPEKFTYHRKSDMIPYKSYLTKGWDTPVAELQHIKND